MVSCEKGDIPMLWLDSSVLIDFAKLENNENIEPARASKLSRLRSVARNAVRAEKLICPEWDQELEFEGERLESNIRRIVSDLSCGARCVPYEGVKDRQVELGLEAYIANADSLCIPKKIHFYENPCTAVRDAKRNGFIVQANMPKPPEWIARG